MFVQNTPAIKVQVNNKFLNEELKSGYTEGYLISVTSIYGRPLFFTVHLETGALFSRLPITALFCDRFHTLRTKPFQYDLGWLQPYSCLEGDINVIEYAHLKNCQVVGKFGYGSEKEGFYLFTVEVIGKGLTEDPEQHKSHNIIVIEDGQLAALPNNKLLFPDQFFTEIDSNDRGDKIWPKYKRNKKYHLAGG